MEQPSSIGISKWLRAMRLRTLPLSFSSILTGSAIVAAGNPKFTGIVLLALLTTFLLQVLSNFANDYGDFRNGADNEQRTGPKRAVQSGEISPKAMLNASILTAILSFAAGIGLLFYSFSEGSQLLIIFFTLLGLAAIGAAFNYTAGKKPYGYRALGDISVLTFFGFVGVLGTSYLHSNTFQIFQVLPALTIGCLAAAVLNLNNMRDIVNDQSSGKVTLAVKLGPEKSKVYHMMLFAVAWTSITLYLIFGQAATLSAIVFLVLPLHIVHLVKVKKNKEPQNLDPELKKIALSTFAIALILFLVNLFTTQG